MHFLYVIFVPSNYMQMTLSFSNADLKFSLYRSQKTEVRKTVHAARFITFAVTKVFINTRAKLDKTKQKILLFFLIEE